MIENTLKTAWANDTTTIGLWISSGDPTTLETLGGVGYDYICFDLQHGLIDYTNVVPGLQALKDSSSMPLARVPWNEPGIIGKVLDAGAMGVIIPMVNTPEEAERAVSACRYAPAGSRSWGPARASAVLGGDYYEDANSHLACIPMIETKQAVDNLESILDVEGIDAVYVGPADLSISYGLRPASDHPDSAVYQEALAKIVEVSRARGVAPGIHTIPGMVKTRIDQGFQMITATSNVLAQVAGVKNALSVARGEDTVDAIGSMY